MKKFKLQKAFVLTSLLSIVFSPIAQVDAVVFQGANMDNNIYVSKVEAQSTTNEILNLIPSTVEFEPMTYDEAVNIINDPVNYFVYTDVVLFEKIYDIIEPIMSQLNISQADYYIEVPDINTCKFHLLENGDYDKVIGEKEIKINYNGAYNTSDEQYVRNKIDSIDFSGLMSEYDMTVEDSEEYYEQKEKEFTSAIEERVNDNSIKVLCTYGSAGGGGYGDIGIMCSHVNFFKNNILYKVIYVDSFTVASITVPDTVEDTDKAYIDYALPIVREYYKGNLTVSKMEKVTDEYILDDEFTTLKNNGDFYKVTFNELDYYGDACWARIMIKKNKIQEEIIEGDLDGNNIVNANDAAIALDLYKYGNVTPEQLKVADMDNNGIINANDAALILDIYKYGN